MAPPTPTSVMLINGRYFDHLDPDPDVIEFAVLEAGLRASRFNVQTTRLISIAEHSLRVRRIVEVLGGGNVDQLRALLHDAAEALVPWGDCLAPGKTDQMREVEANVLDAIYIALGVNARDMFVSGRDGGVSFVKKADMLARYFEAMLWQPGAVDWAPYAIADEIADHLSQFLPVIMPRPHEDWRLEVEALIDEVSR